MTLQNKEVGTTVDFTTGIEIKNLYNRLFYRDDIVGILAYQSAPVTIDSTTRDACVNGNVSDIVTQAGGQGMTVRYAKISWNETAQANGYYITDFRIAIVAQMNRDYNVGTNYLLNALKAIPWLSQIMPKMSLPWQGWLLLNFVRSEALPYKRLMEELQSQQMWVGYPVGTTPPALPDVSTIKTQIMAQGDFNTAFGKFTTELLSKGYSVTYPANAYGVDICLYQSPVGIPVPNNPYARSYYYVVHTRFWWDYTTNPDYTIDEATGRLFAITATFLLALAAIIGAIICGVVVAYNMTHTRTDYVEMDYVKNSDGSPYIDPATGKPVFYPKKTGSTEGPPDWWSGVIQNVAIVALIIGGLVTAVVVIPRLIPERKRK